jgi:methionyl-tRNA synthetase
MGLQPRAVSRDLDWGVPVPVDGAEGKVLYVWFDAPIGYISNTIEHSPDDWEKWWKDPATKLVHFIGKDNIVFHCIVFPSMLKAEGSYILPENVPANEFLNLEGDKISTSHNWAIWLHEYLEDFPGKQDVLRYVLTANAPETKDNDFTWADFQARNNNELVAVAGNFVHRALVLTHKYFDGHVPPCGELTADDRQLTAEWARIRTAIENNLEHYHFREALKETMNLARAGNKYLAEQEPWKTEKTDRVRTATVLHLCLQLEANVAIAFEPFMPFTSEKIKRLIGCANLQWNQLGGADLLSAGHALHEPELLFEKIEDEAIAQQLAKLENARRSNALKNHCPPPVKPEVAFDVFGQLDIRVGKITDCSKAPKTDKLLLLKIDDGMGGRTILSGIAQHYRPEDLIGQSVCFIANLAPRTIKGIESQGMILSAENADGTLSLIRPDGGIWPGSEVK